MSQQYTTVFRKNLTKPDEAPKCYAIARSGRLVSIKEVCKRIAERSSYSKGELEGCINEYLLEMLNVLEEGNIAQLSDLGNFRMTIKTGTPTATAEEFKTHCIERGNVVFYPGKDLRKLCKAMDYTAVSKSKSKSPDEETPDPDDNTGGGENPGDGGGEAPDPTV